MPKKASKDERELEGANAEGAGGETTPFSLPPVSPEDAERDRKLSEFGKMVLAEIGRSPARSKADPAGGIGQDDPRNAKHNQSRSQEPALPFDPPSHPHR